MGGWGCCIDRCPPYIFGSRKSEGLGVTAVTTRDTPLALSFGMNFIDVNSSNIEDVIRKEKLSTFNRLHSIAEDAAWVETVSEQYKHLPIAPNQRCGAWYVNPTIVSVYPCIM